MNLQLATISYWQTIISAGALLFRDAKKRSKDLLIRSGKKNLDKYEEIQNEKKVQSFIDF